MFCKVHLLTILFAGACFWADVSGLQGVPTVACQETPAGTLARLIPSRRFQEGCAVTCEMDGGRLGDNITANAHAKWISYKYAIPFLYKPFQYSDQLVLSDIEQQFTDRFRFQHQVMLVNGKFSSGAEISNQAKSTLFIVPWFPESLMELEMFPNYKRSYFPVDWDDVGFKAEFIKMMCPKVPLALPNIPHDRIVVGVHVRMGGGPDSKDIYKILPTKFPPHSYYIEQIQFISNFFKDKPLYIYLFTDFPDPKEIAKQYEQALGNPNLKFLFREKDNHHARNVLEDLFALTQCDCLIRGESYFSFVASKLTDFQILITPASYKFEGETLIIDKVNIDFGKNVKENLY